MSVGPAWGWRSHARWWSPMAASSRWPASPRRDQPSRWRCPGPDAGLLLLPGLGLLGGQLGCDGESPVDALPGTGFVAAPVAGEHHVYIHRTPRLCSKVLAAHTTD